MTWDEECPVCFELIDDIWGRSFDYTRAVRCPHCETPLCIVSIGKSRYGLGQPHETTSEIVRRNAEKLREGE
jgi:hypothetical protein